MTGPRLGSQRQHPYHRRMSKSERAAIVDRDLDVWAFRHPEKDAIMKRWRDGAIDGAAAYNLLQKVEKRLVEEVERELERPEK